MYSTETGTPAHAIKWVEVDASRALERSRRPCAREMVVLNPAEGCLGGCLFCPVRQRGRDSGVISLRTNLPELLERELQLRRRRGSLPGRVLFNSRTDCFQPVGPLLTLTHELMRLVLEAGCDLYFITRGSVPEGFGELFQRFCTRVHAQVSLFSLDENLVDLYEPFAAAPRQRLDTMRRLHGWGVDVRGRVDPLIPFLSDTAGHIEDLVRHMRSAGLERTAASYLVLRPQMLETFQAALPAAHHHVIRGSFKGQAWRKVGIHQMTKLLPERTRAQGYERLRAIGKRLGMNVDVCACSDPELGVACLAPPPESGEAPKPGQLDLFSTA